MKSDGDTGGGGDCWEDKYWCWVTGNAVISLTPFLTDIVSIAAKSGVKLILDTVDPHLYGLLGTSTSPYM